MRKVRSCAPTFYMPGVARGMSSNRFGESFFLSFPFSPSHLKLVANRIGSLGFLRVPWGSLGFLRVL